MIAGVVVTPLRQIIDERGKVMHMLREDSPVFQRFGEIYFSCAEPGAVKAWRLHHEMTLNYAVLIGKIKLVLFDGRTESPTHGETQEFFLSTENYSLITVPPMIWYGFKSIGDCTAMIANCATTVHSPTEIERMPPSNGVIPYDWGIVHG